MFKRTKCICMAVAMSVSIFTGGVLLVSAAEVSNQVVSVQQDQKQHSVAVFGKSVAIVYADGRSEIIPNNETGRIDVMIDGKLTKGVGTVAIPVSQRANMVLEEGSFIVKGISEENATALKSAVIDALANDAPITEISVLAGEQSVQGSTTYTVGEKGSIQNVDGKVVTNTGISVKSTDTAYTEFSEAVETSIREEQERVAAEEAARIAAEASKNDTVSGNSL